jgi:hypothetical protein
MKLKDEELENIEGRKDRVKQLLNEVSKWRLHFQDALDELYDLARSGRPSRSDLAAPIELLLQ